MSTEAYCRVQLYGTNEPLEAIVEYYRPRLAAQGWQLLGEHGSPPDYSVGFVRSRGEVVGIAGGRYASAHLFPEGLPAEGATRFTTMYSVDITRTEGPVAMELATPHPE